MLAATMRTQLHLRLRLLQRRGGGTHAAAAAAAAASLSAAAATSIASAHADDTAAGGSPPPPPPRLEFSGRFDDQLAELRRVEPVLRLRWRHDEAGWRKLPSRAWPARQPKGEEVPALQAAVAAACTQAVRGDKSTHATAENSTP